MRRIPRWTSWVALIGLWACSGPESDLPESYRTIAVPEDVTSHAPAAVERGREVFLEYCALCHGENADGRGVRQNLSSHPRDLSQPAWCRTVTPRRLYFVVREGVQGTAMPSWKALSEEESWDVVAHLLSVCEAGDSLSWD